MGRGNFADEWPPLRSVTDLALRHWNVRLTCERCGTQRVIHGAAMWKLFDRKRWDDHIASAARRFHCAYCRKQDGSLVRPKLAKTKDDPTGAALELPSDYEWKKLVARYRS
jgi:hypothetical protein